MGLREQLLFSFAQIVFPIYLAILGAVAYWPPYVSPYLLQDLFYFVLAQLWALVVFGCWSLGLRPIGNCLVSILFLVAGGVLTWLSTRALRIFQEFNLSNLV